MFLIPYAMLFLLTSCGALPQLFQATEDVADDTAIKVEVSKEALAREPDLRIQIDVKNKDQPTQKS